MEEKRIILFSGHYVRVLTIDFDYLNQFSWHKISKHYAGRSESIDGQKHTILMHREIIQRMGFILSSDVDHKNMDDEIYSNIRDNLRIATTSQNLANQRKQLGTTSNYKGVSFDKGTNKWRAYIKFEGKRLYLGLFDTEEAAAKEYNGAAKMLFGEFARLNEIINHEHQV
jgi:hypothetical protein